MREKQQSGGIMRYCWGTRVNGHDAVILKLPEPLGHHLIGIFFEDTIVFITNEQIFYLIKQRKFLVSTFRNVNK